MKLILCLDCQDVVRLVLERRECQCGKCWGRYVDDVNAEVSEGTTVLGFANSTLVQAVRNPNMDPDGPGKRFTAFVIPQGCQTVKEIKDE